MKQLDTFPFVSQGITSSTSKNQLATMIDLDLQFVLVPVHWVNIIVLKRMTRVHDLLHAINTKNIVASLNNAQETDRIRLEAFRFNHNMEKRENVNLDHDKHFSTILVDLMKVYYKINPCKQERELFDKDKAY